MFQDSDFRSKEKVGTPQTRTHVDRVASGVAIVNDNFDNIVMAYDVGVCVLAVNNGIRGLVTGVENSEESRDFGFYVGYVVDCEARGVVSHCLLALRAKGVFTHRFWLKYTPDSTFNVILLVTGSKRACLSYGTRLKSS